MSYSNRVSFRKTYESPDCDNDRGEPDSTVWHHHLMCGGSISVQHRLTGYGYGTWDEETAYMSPCGKFWLATCGVAIRDCLDEFDSEEGMIQRSEKQRVGEGWVSTVRSGGARMPRK